MNSKPQVVAYELFITNVPFVKILTFEIVDFREDDVSQSTRCITSGGRNPGIVIIRYEVRNTFLYQISRRQLSRELLIEPAKTERDFLGTISGRQEDETNPWLNLIQDFLIDISIRSDQELSIPAKSEVHS